jgi:hypothetical protein
MKARLLPLHFSGGPSKGFEAQVRALRGLFGEDAEILQPAPLGAPVLEADGVVFPEILGEAYRRLNDFKRIPVPILLVTSEFGTLSMWDWEIASYLRAENIVTIAPYNAAQARLACRALGVKRELQQTRFLVYQDNPGEGFQAEIFKRFYWWEEECSQRIKEKFGVTMERRSFRELGARAKDIPDAAAREAADGRPVATGDVPERSLLSAVKLYLAVKADLDANPSIRAAGINCLNESHFSETTPCLAWNILYEERRLMWGCEADTMSMLTKYILHHSLDVPIMMTNLYPFVLGQAALKHERIEKFPEMEAPGNCVLVAHCGYLGVLPRPFAAEWTLRRKVLAIVDENATAIDARFPEGDITLAKLDPRLERLAIAEGRLEGYAQYPGSDCRNGAVLRFRDGHRLMDRLISHHYLLMKGHCRPEIEIIAKVFGLGLDAV